MLIDDYIFYTKDYKKQYGDKTVVLMQVGQFYEMYSKDDNTESDIYKIADICGITVSKKNKKTEEVSINNPLMCGFPLYVISKYQNILLQNNYTIVMIEQSLEDKTNRGVSEILSPGMNINISTKKTNYMMVIYYEKIKELLVAGVACIDISTGENFLYEIGTTNEDKDYTNNEIFRLIISYNPCELLYLCNNSLNNEDYNKIKRNINLNNNILIHYLWESYEYIDIIEKLKYQEIILNKIYKNIKSQLSIIEILNLEYLNIGRIAFCCLLQFAYNHNADIMNDLLKPKILNSNINLNLEYDSALQLNVISLNNNEKPLIEILNRCKTSFGSRLFKQRLLQPIIDKEKLNKRYDEIEKYLENNLFEELGINLNKILDIERIKRRIIINKLNPHEWNGINTSFENILIIYNKLNKDDKKIKEIIDYYNILNFDNVSKYTLADIKGNLFNKGIKKDLDELDKEYDEIYKNIKNISNNITLIGKNEDTICKVEYSDKDGYYIYITKKRYDTAKIQNQKLMNNFNIISKSQQGYYKITSNELIDLSNKLNSILIKISSLSKKYYIEFMNKFINEYSNNLTEIINTIANIDITYSNAKNAYEYRYYRPKIINNESGGYIKALEARHPIIERLNENVKYIGNDIEISNKGLLLYGINTSGKSSLMKTIGLVIIMAQSGMFVPSYDMIYEPYHHIFTRISGSDNIYKGLSSFTVEMTELRNILKRSDNHSLVLGDELCNGTESISGISIVSSAIDELLKKSCSFIFTTHLHELVDVPIIKKYIENKNLEILHLHIEIINDVIYYERKLKLGKGSSVYGIEVCKSLDMPYNFMMNAEKIRKELQGLDSFLISLKKNHYNKDIYIEKCSICNNNVDDIHHINYQKDSDKNGYFKNYHKNIKHNLVPLCKKCHIKEHNGEISIKGYIDTSEGIKLKVENNNENNNKNNNKNNNENNNINNENNNINNNENNNLILKEDDIKNIKKYILYNKNKECLFRLNKTSKYSICTNEKKILNKINKLLNTNINKISENIKDLLIDYNI